MENQKTNEQMLKDPKDINDNKLLAAIGYLGILCLLPLLLKKDSEFAQYHGKQGLVLLIAWVIVSFINIIPILGWLAWFVLSIIFFVLMVTGVIKALQGEYWQMPVLGAYAKKINL